MSRLLPVIGTLLMAASLAGAGLLAQHSTFQGQAASDGQGASTLAAGEQLDSSRPVTRLVIARIGLDTEVVPAKLVSNDGARTWQVPALKAGHAESSAGAGEPGNALLLGHLTSIGEGNVFARLHELQTADVVRVFSGPMEFDYRVTDARKVGRADLSVLRPTSAPSVSLITCDGLWLPFLWDYTDRFVVRGELMPAG